MLILSFSIAAAMAGLAPFAAQAGAVRDTIALIGTWQLDLGRTHYGPGVERRRREQMQCGARGSSLTCVVESTRADGRKVRARFTTRRAGGKSSVLGVVGIDSVELRPQADGLVDATFSYRGQPRYGYRAFRSADGRSLIIVAVDPVTRIALSSIVVYSRVGTSGRAVSPDER